MHGSPWEGEKIEFAGILGGRWAWEQKGSGMEGETTGMGAGGISGTS